MELVELWQVEGRLREVDRRMLRRLMMIRPMERRSHARDLGIDQVELWADR